MKKLQLVMMVVVFSAFAIGSQVHAFTVTTTFNAGAESWTTHQNDFGTSGTEPDPGWNLDWVSSGGVGNTGYITQLDWTLQFGYVKAPVSFNSIDSSNYNGSFEFYLRHHNSDPELWPRLFNVRVAMTGNGLSLINEVGSLPTDSWTSYDFTLNEGAGAGWRSFSNINQDYSTGGTVLTEAQYKDVLDNVTGVFISADYTFAFELATEAGGPHIDRTDIDSVTFTEGGPPPPVPEPGTWILMGIGVVGLAMYGYRRKKQRLA